MKILLLLIKTFLFHFTLMYVSRRRNVRSGGGILFFAGGSVNIDAIHPIGSLLFSQDAYYDPNNDENLEGTTWVLLNYDDYSIATTNIPILAGMVSGDNKVHGQLNWENLPRHEIVSVGNTSENGNHSHSVDIWTDTSGNHTHEVYAQGYYNCDSGSARQPLSREIIWSDPSYRIGNTNEQGWHSHHVTGNTISDGTHSHTVTSRAYEGGYIDEEEEDHPEGKSVDLLANPKTIRCLVWKRTA